MGFSCFTSVLSVHQFTARWHARSEIEVMTSFSRSVCTTIRFAHMREFVCDSKYHRMIAIAIIRWEKEKQSRTCRGVHAKVNYIIAFKRKMSNFLPITLICHHPIRNALPLLASSSLIIHSKEKKTTTKKATTTTTQQQQQQINIISDKCHEQSNQ